MPKRRKGAKYSIDKKLEKMNKEFKDLFEQIDINCDVNCQLLNREQWNGMNLQVI